jgi:3-isopropylmalate dehydrogenase
MTAHTLAVLRGDGVGPEVIESALSILGACVPVKVREARVGGAAIDASGDPLPPETLEICRASNAVLLGAVGGPKWATGPRPEDGLLRLRQGLGLFANVRVCRDMGLPTPLRETLVRQADIVVVRELSGGVYFGEPRGISPTAAFNTWRRPRTRCAASPMSPSAWPDGAATASPRWTRRTCSRPRACGARS